MRKIRILKSGRLNYPYMGSCNNRRAILNERDLLVDTAGFCDVLSRDMYKTRDVINTNAETSKRMLKDMRKVGAIFSGNPEP